MQTFTVQINNNSALKALEDLIDKQFISIIDTSDFASPALPGKSLSLTAFKNWINEAESVSTVSLFEAKSRWVSKRKQLQKLTK